MSQLDVLLLELKRAIDEKRVNQGSTAVEDPVRETVDPTYSKSALRKFITSADYNVRTQEPPVMQHPRVIEAMRKSLNEFIAEPLRNNGTTTVSGILCHEQTEKHEPEKVESSSPDAGKKELPPFSPSQGNELAWAPPCAKCAERSQQSTKQAQPSSSSVGSTETAAVQPTSSSTLPGAALSTSSYRPYSPAQSAGSSNLSVSAISTPSRTEASPTSTDRARDTSVAAAPAQAEQPKSAVQALLNVFGSRVKSQNRNTTEEPVRKRPNTSDVERCVPSPTQAPPATPIPAPGVEEKDSVDNNSAPLSSAKPVTNNSTVVWFKHFQAVESAIQMSDVHFASVLLAILVEVADAVTAPPNIMARLKSFDARIAIELKNYEQAERTLKQAIDELGSANSSNISAAYCWYALATCHHRQGKTTAAKDAKEQAILIATEALGAKDPETLHFHEPLN